MASKCSSLMLLVIGVSAGAIIVSLTVAHAQRTIVYEPSTDTPSAIGVTLTGMALEAVRAPQQAASAEAPRATDATVHATTSTTQADEVRTVPFYSQFEDIAWESWRGKSCGIANVAMVIDYYHRDAPTPQTLLERGTAAGYYREGVGWSHRGLVNLAERHGVTGSMHGFAGMSKTAAYRELAAIVERGPVIASVHNKFDPKSTVPHLVVVRDIRDGKVYYNDPAEDTGSISSERFKRAWKQRIIAMEAAL